MIVLRAFTLFFCLFFTTTASAEAKVYIGDNVYKPTADRWYKAADEAAFDSTTWIWNIKKDKKHRNGSRDSILIVPDQAAPEDVTLVVWFHGLGGFNQKTFSKRIIPQLEDAVLGGNSVVLTVPEMPWSTNTSTPRKRQGRVWRSPGELERYIADVREHLEVWAIIEHAVPLGNVRIVFVGHSAGGSALSSAAREGGLCRLKPEAIIWSDASYGRWLDVAWKSCIKDADTELHILVRKGDKPHRNAERVHKIWKRTGNLPGRNLNMHYNVLDRRYWSHGKIGKNVFSLTDLFPPGC